MGETEFGQVTVSGERWTTTRASQGILFLFEDPIVSLNSPHFPVNP